MTRIQRGTHLFETTLLVGLFTSVLRIVPWVRNIATKRIIHHLIPRVRRFHTKHLSPIRVPTNLFTILPVSQCLFESAASTVLRTRFLNQRGYFKSFTESSVHAPIRSVFIHQNITWLLYIVHTNLNLYSREYEYKLLFPIDWRRSKWPRPCALASRNATLGRQLHNKILVKNDWASVAVIHYIFEVLVKPTCWCCD